MDSVLGLAGATAEHSSRRTISRVADNVAANNFTELAAVMQAHVETGGKISVTLDFGSTAGTMHSNSGRHGDVHRQGLQRIACGRAGRHAHAWSKDEQK